jgi:hypothetical protein
MEMLLPNLPEETVEFIYPQATLSSVDQLNTQFEKAWENTVVSGHDIVLYPANESGVYDVIVPHTYYIERKDGSFGDIGIISRMSIHTGLSTKLDPTGEKPKLFSYLVNIESVNDRDVSQEIAALRVGKTNVNYAKAFVHKWFENADAKNADALAEMASSGELDINLLGTAISDRQGLFDYLSANGGAQVWATHTPQNISVTATDDGFLVKFLVHFEGEIKEMGTLSLNNRTTWHLIEEEGELRLRDYELTML